jgi:hypothetical protein
MPKGWKARPPNYYYVIFSKSNTQYPIDGGVYPVPAWVGSNVSEGDVLLLHQELMVPAIGVVISNETSVETSEIDYQFFPLDPPVVWFSQANLKDTIPELDTPFSYKRNWIQKINKSSFLKVLKGTSINW